VAGTDPVQDLHQVLFDIGQAFLFADEVPHMVPVVEDGFPGIHHTVGGLLFGVLPEVVNDVHHGSSVGPGLAALHIYAHTLKALAVYGANASGRMGRKR